MKKRRICCEYGADETGHQSNFPCLDGETTILPLSLCELCAFVRGLLSVCLAGISFHARSLRSLKAQRTRRGRLIGRRTVRVYCEDRRPATFLKPIGPDTFLELPLPETFERADSFGGLHLRSRYPHQDFPIEALAPQLANRPLPAALWKRH